jgi:hypothetical protein
MGYGAMGYGVRLLLNPLRSRNLRALDVNSTSLHALIHTPLALLCAVCGFQIVQVKVRGEEFRIERKIRALLVEEGAWGVCVGVRGG